MLPVLTIVYVIAQASVTGCSAQPEATPAEASVNGSENDPGLAAAPPLAAAVGVTAAEEAQIAQLPLGRYQCYRMGQEAISIATDLDILAGNRYELAGGTGAYGYTATTGAIVWTTGPLHHPSEGWVGVFTAKGSATPLGGRTVGDIIEVRTSADIAAGNKRVLQECTRA